MHTHQTIRRVRPAAALAALALIAALTAGCGGKTDQAADRKAFTSAPDVNKLTPEQRKMVDAFSHHSAGAPAPGTPATR